jgi:hypothetical protein
MFTHKKIISALLIFSMLAGGCATTYAPRGWLPETEAVPMSTYGGWIRVVTTETSDPSEKKWLEYSGEFIASDSEHIYILYDSLYVLHKDKITTSSIELDKKNTGLYSCWTAAGIASTISHGFYLIITAPLWIMFGIPSASGESFRDRYFAEPPDQIYWNDLNKFSRYPQGLSEIELSELRPLITKTPEKSSLK